MTKSEKLQEAGLLSRDSSYTAEQHKAIESLSEEEVNALISVWGKLSNSFTGGTDAVLGESILPPRKPR